mgnify:CR=1 FL=1
MVKFFKKNWIIICAEILIIVAFFTFYGKFGDSVIDSFREAYIPIRILDGKILYKNIFTIYAPFAYIFNATLFAIFGTKLHILYYAGLFSVMGICYLTYKISSFFLDKLCTTGILLFLIAGLVLSSNVFNPFFPYSYGILYGLLFVLCSIYFGLKGKFPLAYLFCSLAICSKYEFILSIIPLILLSRKTNWQRNVVSFILPFLITFLPLFFMGLGFKDLITTLNLIGLMTATKSLGWFYSVTGLTFRFEHIPIYIINLVKFIIPVYWKLWQEILIWIFPTVFLLFCIKFKKLNSQEKFFITVSLLISAKVFFALTLQSYGVYFIPFGLISLFILMPEKFKKYSCAMLIIWSLIVGANNINAYTKKDTTILDNTVDFVNNNTQPSDRVLVYPEGLKVNVLTGRGSDDKFYSLIPLYVETFGEDLITKRLDITKPEFIITTNYDTSAYYFHKFGEDYAVDIKKYITTNYTLIKKDDYAEYYKLKN